MSLFSKEEPHGLAESLQILVNRNQLQALKTSGAQPRPGNNSPNPIASQPSLTAPQHVQSVQVRQQRTSDMSTRCTVTFQRNPADPLFVETRVFVSGYKGNPQPVQVGSGQSPVSFALENSGEPVTVTVQAAGNLGKAPLSTAPTTTMQLAKTPLATTPTAAGNGTTPSSAATFGLSNPSWWGSGDGSSYSMSGNPNGQWGTGTANQVKVWMVRIPYSITISKLTFRHLSSVVGAKGAFGMYNSAGTTK